MLLRQRVLSLIRAPNHCGYVQQPLFPAEYSFDFYDPSYVMYDPPLFPAEYSFDFYDPSYVMYDPPLFPAEYSFDFYDPSYIMYD